MIKSSYHVHTKFCDGSSSPKQMVKAALKSGLTDIGFSAHSAYPFSSNFHMQIKDFNKYTKIINNLKKQYKNKINIKLGFEAEYIKGITAPDFELYKVFNPDYLIGSVHYVFPMQNLIPTIPWCVDAGAKEVYEGLERCFNGDIKTALKAYFLAIREMVSNYSFDIVGHLDLPRKRNKELNMFDEKSSWYLEEVEKTIKSISKTNKIIELNTNGYTKGYVDSFYPSTEVLSIIKHYNIPITLNSDAHIPSHIDSSYKEAYKVLKSLGIKEIFFLSPDGWEASELP